MFTIFQDPPSPTPNKLQNKYRVLQKYIYEMGELNQTQGELFKIHFISEIVTKVFFRQLHLRPLLNNRTFFLIG